MEHKVYAPVDASLHHKIKRSDLRTADLVVKAISHALNRAKEGGVIRDPCYRTTRSGSIRVTLTTEHMARLRELMSLHHTEDTAMVLRCAISDYLDYRGRYTTRL